MSDKYELTRIVALWEFRRFFKWKDQLKGILISLVSAAVGYAIVGVVMRDEPEAARVAVLHAERLPITIAEEDVVQLEPADADEAEQLAEQVGDGRLDGLLTIRAPNDIELLVFKEPPWQGTLTQAIEAAQFQQRLTAARVSPEQFAAIVTPSAELQVEIHPAGKAPSSTGDKIAAGILIGLMLMGVFQSMGLFMIAVTGEKQLRVTEQIVAAVPPQIWIDGKLIGLTLATVGSIISLSISGLIFYVAWQLWQEGAWQLPAMVFDVRLVAAFAVLALLGLLFWNAFFAAVAAVIDDPNTSSRSVLLIMPALPVGLCFFALASPDTTSLQVLSLVPGFSSSLLPARMVLTDVAWWEFPVAVIALIVGLWAMRRLAGRIFQAAILMYGKEPGWKQMWRWVWAK